MHGACGALCTLCCGPRSPEGRCMVVHCVHCVMDQVG